MDINLLQKDKKNYIHTNENNLYVGGNESEMMNSVYEKKILIVDDEKNILNIMTTVFKKENFLNVFTAQSGIEGIDICREISPDIIILDIMLPDIDGIEVCRKIRSCSNVPIIFLSARAEEIDRLLGLGMGGDDYVTKPFSPKEIVYRAKAIFRREQYLQRKKMGDSFVKFGNIIVDKEKKEVLKHGKLVELTAKEYKLLIYMIENINIVLSKECIVEAIWGGEYKGYDNTVMVHIRRLREKIEDNPSMPKYILTCKGLGYKLVNGE